MKHSWSTIDWCVRCGLNRLQTPTEKRYYGIRNGQVFSSSSAGVCDGWVGYPRDGSKARVPERIYKPFDLGPPKGQPSRSTRMAERVTVPSGTLVGNG